MPSTKNIVIIVPAFNEEIPIGSIVILSKMFSEKVIVIDDSSNDGTGDIAEKAGATVIRHISNTGKGGALKTGFEAAIKEGADIIVTIDADGQHDPREIPSLIAPVISDEADLVIGSRYLLGNRKDTPVYRRIGQTVLDHATKADTGLALTDTQSGFRAFSAKYASIFQFKQSGFAIESEMLSDAADAGLRIKEVEIGVRYDVNGSTEHPVTHGFHVFIKILQDMELNRPLLYFTFPGIILTVIGLGMGLYFLDNFYHGRGLFFGPTLLMILLTLIGAFLTLTGIILDSMKKMFMKYGSK
jgi:glycosyltransferase involved in cell wall biosynthesis